MRRGTSIVLVLGAGPLLMAPAAAQGIRPPTPTYEKTIKALAACGVPAANVRITYEDDLQSDVVAIRDPGGTDEARLRCVNQSVHPFYLVEFADGAANAAYQSLVFAEARRRDTLEGRRWLQARGLLQGMPRYRVGTGRLPKFVRKAEAHCSVKPGSAVEILTPTSVTLRIGFMRSMLSSASRSHGERLTCLMNVLAVSGLAEGGVNFGFVGNEATATERDDR